ncbi:MAG: iron chelate uptake ABC transporter family permease subunit, partial [Kutzneria sp.]|nr:iron chelate uptake ABC transporter family permease subunit [Kutzneria sp.]
MNGPRPARLRSAAVPAIAVGGLAIVAALSVRIGDLPTSVGDILRVLSGGGDETQRYVLLALRLPRVLIGAFAGAAFGVSGALTQSIARNPLASPDVLGVTPGAAAGAVGVIV